MRHLGMNSPRTASVLIDLLIDKGYFERDSQTKKLRLIKEAPTGVQRAVTVNVPLLGHVAAGMPILAEENIDTILSIDEALLPRKRATYYALRVHGDSMNESGINDGDIAIVEQTDTAREKQMVVALIDEEATIKHIHFDSDKVVLMPNSSNPKNQPIVLRRDFQIQGVVVNRLNSGVI